MYLEFIKDMVSVGTKVSIKIKENDIEGEILKISDAMVAIKCGNSIQIIKDEDIEDIKILNIEPNAEPSLVLKTEETAVDADSVDDEENMISTVNRQNNKETDVQSQENVKNIPLQMPTDRFETDVQIKQVGYVGLSVLNPKTRPERKSKSKANKPKQGTVAIRGEKFGKQWDIDTTGIVKLIDDLIYGITKDNSSVDVDKCNVSHIISFDGFAVVQVEQGEKLYDANISTIIEPKLYESVRKGNNNLEVVISVYNDNVNLIVLPNDFLGYLKLLRVSVEQRCFVQSKLLVYFLANSTSNSNVKSMLLQRIAPKMDIIKTNQYYSVKSDEDKIKSRKYNNFDKVYNKLMSDEKYDEALALIDQALADDSLMEKYKVSLLTKKEIVYRQANDLEKAIEVNLQLLRFRVSQNAGKSSLCSLCFSIAQSYLLLEKVDEAKEYLRRSLYYVPDFAQSLHLLDQINNGVELNEYLFETTESVAHSKMLDADIREHKYMNETIINNANTPTALVAKRILDEAKEIRDVNSSTRYVAYLEAAKAYGELADTDTKYESPYHESIAYYAMLKGNYLYTRFRDYEYKDTEHLRELLHIKDSACSYYIESLSYLAKLPSSSITGILRNYLWISIACFNISESMSILEYDNLKTLLRNNILHENESIRKIVWNTILEFGAASSWAWHKFIKSNAIGYLINVLNQETKRIDCYKMINEMESIDVDMDLKPGAFLKEAFVKISIKKQNLVQLSNDLISTSFDTHELQLVKNLWDKLGSYKDMLSSTDLEHKEAGDEVLGILTPYLNRNERERINLLIQSQDILDSQIVLINENTTYYGRILFFPLFTKWRRTIQNILKDKRINTIPCLKVVPDPSYIVRINDMSFIQMIIKNEGDSTAEGYMVEVEVEDVLQGLKTKCKPKEKTEEIVAGGKVELSMNLPFEMNNSALLECKIQICAIYQGKNTEVITYRFSVEREPIAGVLKEEDIEWQSGRIPLRHMFKGRELIIDKLVNHYISIDRYQTYILYGLTRTGKSSILTYLGEKVRECSISQDGEEFKIIPFNIPLDIIADNDTKEDLWGNMLEEYIADVISKRDCRFQRSEYKSARDFIKLMNHLRELKWYPLIMIDEFTYIKSLMDRGVLTPAFLSTIRELAFSGLASFIFAGTFEVKELIRDEKYGITGQLVNTIEEQIGAIDRNSAEELMNAMKDKIKFTDEAIDHIHILSGDVPYFIQIICHNCALYAIENNRMYIGYPELENVVKILTGEILNGNDSRIKQIPEGMFQGNMDSATDSPDVNTVITCISYLNKNNIDTPRGVSIKEIQQLWIDKKIPEYRSRVADAVRFLEQDKKILIQYQDEGVPSYKISVDISRRWWAVHHKDIDLEFDSLTKII